MKSLLKNLFLFSLLAFLIFFFRDVLQEGWREFYQRYFPCRRPIAYTLGSFDREFGISEEKFLKIVKEAENIWEGPIGKDLFVYKEEGGNILQINLIYDYRQEATEQIEDLGEEVEATRASYDALKTKYDSMQAKYISDKSIYQNKISLFKSRQDEYTKDVEYWNKRGGAPRGEYEKLSAEGEALEEGYKEVKRLENDLNRQVTNINTLVLNINNLAKSLNIDVATLNTIGEARGEEFTQGEYRNTPGTEEINIYEFSTEEKLRRVLAHEFGHALSLEHVEDPEAIMYRLNQNKNGKLAPGDLDALKKLCGII